MSLVTLATLMLLAALAAGVVAFIRRFPVIGVVTWLLVIAFVPIWVIVPTPLVSPSAASGMAGLVAVGLALRSGSFRWTFADLLAAFVVITATGPVLVGLVPVSAALSVFVIWGTAFLAGRLVLLHVDAGLLYAAIAVIFGLVGLLALVEFGTGWHGLSAWGPSNGARVTWGTIQERAGLSRAEGAFGHSIALGSTLAMTAVLAMQARLPSVARLGLIGLMVGGVAVTLSRGSLVSLGLGLVLALLFVPEKRVRELRSAIAVLSVAGLALLAPWVLGVFTQAGAEASGSAAYRGDLISLLDVVEVVGRSAAIQVTPQGNTYINGFRSIDNQMLIFGLNFGWLMIGVVIVVMTVAGLALASGRATLPCAAMVAQVPALITVALITQYAVVFWFVLGLAVGAEQLRAHPGDAGGRRPDPEEADPRSDPGADLGPGHDAGRRSRALDPAAARRTGTLSSLRGADPRR